MNRYSHTIKEATLAVLFVIVAIAASAQSQRAGKDVLLYEKVQRLGDSIDNLNLKKIPLYLGYEISFAFPQYQIQSNISQLNNVRASFSGGAVGGVFANQKGKIKANVGLYYSDASVPYSIDVFRTSITSSVYLLRLKESKHHTIEPYSVIGVSHQMNRFFGHYLDNTVRKNYSVANEPLLGTVSTTQVSFGGGLEYQLENDRHKFIHFFTEFTYSKNINTTSSNTSFSGTKISDPLLITVGLNFGIIK